MAIRETLAKSPVVGIALVIVLLAVAGWVFVAGGRVETRNLSQGYFFDLGTNQIYLHTNDEHPPVVAPSGGVGVRAFVYSCTDCADLDTRFVGYLQKYTDIARQALQSGSPPPEDIESNILVRLEEGVDDDWVPQNTPKGAAIRDAASTRCPGSNAKQCYP